VNFSGRHEYHSVYYQRAEFLIRIFFLLSHQNLFWILYLGITRTSRRLNFHWR